MNKIRRKSNDWCGGEREREGLSKFERSGCDLMANIMSYENY